MDEENKPVSVENKPVKILSDHQQLIVGLQAKKNAAGAILLNLIELHKKKNQEVVDMAEDIGAKTKDFHAATAALDKARNMSKMAPPPNK